MNCKALVLFLILLALPLLYAAQTPAQDYTNFIRMADSLYEAKQYKPSAEHYSYAFKCYGWKGTANDRYNAACSWALANVPDSAFFQLLRISAVLNYTDLFHISNDPDLYILLEDKRWEEIIQKIKDNKEKAEAKLNKPLVALLDSIFYEDQYYRLKLDDIRKQYGWDSKELKDLWKVITHKDSINLISVTALLDRFGWLGPDEIGSQGNTTLFLVIQHSNQATQEKYLPMMREAVKNGKAKASSLALLEDRVAIGRGKRQIYGSQIGTDDDTKSYFLLPLDDPENVDKRRAEVGLGPVADYLKRWNIIWDAKQYKKDLPKLEKKLKAKQKTRKSSAK